MISTTDFKKGKKILFNNEPYMVLDYVSVKPGKGGAYIRTKMKNMLTGLVHEETFRSGEKFEQPDLEYKDMQYLYEDNGLYNFMDTDSYEQFSFNKDQIEEVFAKILEKHYYELGRLCNQIYRKFKKKKIKKKIEYILATSSNVEIKDI